MRMADCHPDRKHFCKGLCTHCYRIQPHVKAREAMQRASKEHRAYLRERMRGAVGRRLYHGFSEGDEARFQAATHCDWCGQPFIVGEKPSIDHDHKCCPKPRHCYKCTRGFVHAFCNTHAIGYYEWFEKQFGITHNLLFDYRMRTQR